MLPVPQPKSYPLIKHAYLLMGGRAVRSFMKLSRQFEGIFRLRVGPNVLTLVYDPEMVGELCDETKYRKVVYSALFEVRAFAGDGLFTAHHGEENWGKAHRILTPGFSAKSMKDYLPQMIEVAGEMVNKWRSVGDQPLMVADEMTRLTLDTISICGFDYRFHSFRKKELHPFLKAMGKALREAGERISRPPFLNRLLLSDWRYQRSIRVMNQLVDQVIEERMKTTESGADAGRPPKNDFLSMMLNGTDRKTGTKLDPLNIRYQILTFLIAGHETTSGLLSFIMYELLKNPEIRERARIEADEVLGGVAPNEIGLGHISRMKYIQQILNEGLRMYPTAPLFSVAPFEDQVLGGKYFIEKDRPLAIAIGPLHRSTKYWGPNPDRFDPSHFDPEKESTRPAYAFRPFGNGQRSCIGRSFAMAEASLALGMILLNFDFDFAEPYELKIKETLTIKPDGFRIRVKPRPVLAKRPAFEHRNDRESNSKQIHLKTVSDLFGISSDSDSVSFIG